MDDKNNTTTKGKEVNNIHEKPFVLHIITRAFWGGAQRYVYDIATDTTEYLQAVATESTGTLVDELHGKGVTVYPLNFARRSILPIHDILTFFSILQLLRRTRPDIVHLHSSKMGFIGSVACRIVGIKKIIFTIHGWPYNEDRPQIVRNIFKVLSVVTLACAHKTIAVSKAVYRTRPFRLYESKIVQIYLAIEAPKFKNKEKAREILLHKTDFIENSDLILLGIIGELIKNKGHTILFHAFKMVNDKYPNTRLLCVGTGDLLPELHTLARKLNINKMIGWINNLNRAAIFMKAFDIIISPSYTEALGYVPLEAGLASVARVATNVGGMPEIIHNGTTGMLVPKENVHALATAIIKCVEDKELREKLGSQAHTDLQPFTDIEKMRSQIYEIYGE